MDLPDGNDADLRVYQDCASLVRVLEAQGRDTSADRVRDVMDDLWYALTDAARRELDRETSPCIATGDPMPRHLTATAPTPLRLQLASSLARHAAASRALAILHTLGVSATMADARTITEAAIEAYLTTLAEKTHENE